LQSDAPIAKTPRIKENLSFEFGWKLWVDGRFKQKKMHQGGGNQTLDIPRHASLQDCLKWQRGLFFPNGKSPEGEESVMSFSMEITVVRFSRTLRKMAKFASFAWTYTSE